MDPELTKIRFSLGFAGSREPDGRNVYNNICYGMFVTFKAPNKYTRDCFRQYGLLTDVTLASVFLSI